MGRTSVSGFIVHRQTSGAENLYQTFFSVLSAGGPVHSIEETILIDGKPVSFGPDGGALGADYAGFMWRDIQLGFAPETKILQSSTGPVPGWGASAKLSGYAAYCLTLKFDKKGKVFAAGVPEPSVVLYGVRAYDPRQDSTYPGGSGSHRANDESTWTFTDNAFLHGLTWLIGRHQNGRRVIGVGAPLDGIDVPAYVEACNIALANGWKMGGLVYSTDEKWNALKAILQSGGGEPCRIGATISCTINAPRVSLDTIRSSDLVGEASVSGTQSRRERINAVVPRYRSEAHGWEMVPAALVRVDNYIAEDGGRRTKEIEFPLVQDAKLAAELAAYEIVNAREFGPIVLPLKPRWIGYKPGDCLTIDVPELNMVGQTAIVMNRSLDPSTGIVTLTLRSETPAKHDFALGRTANPPPTPSLQVIDPSQLLIPGISAVWGAIADDGGKPDDNADVTGEHTSLDTANVAGRPAAEVRAEVEAATLAIGGIAGEFDKLTTDTEAALSDIGAKARQGSPNAIVNPEFKDGLAGWTAPPEMLALWSTGPDGPRGTILATAAPGEIYLDQLIEAFPGLHNGLSFEMEGSAGGGGQIIWLNSSMIEIARSTELRATGWQRAASITADTSFTPPPSAKYGLVRLRKAAGPGVIAFTRIQYQGGLPTDFRSDPAAIVRTRLDALSAQVNTTGAGTVAARIADQIEVAASPQGSIGARFERIEAEFNPADAGSLAAGVARSEQAGVDNARAVASTREAVSTSIGLKTLNRNSNMALWVDGAAIPDGWGAWEYPGGRLRSAGRYSAYSFEQVNPAIDGVGGPAGLYQDPNLSPALASQGVVYVVAEATITFVEGDLRGCGLFWQSNAGNGILSFATTVPLGEDAAPGAGVAGRTYSFAVMSRLDSGSGLIFYAMTHWAGFGFPGSQKRIRWHQASLRLATVQEIAAGKALDGLAGKASVEQLNNALVDERGARAAAIQDIRVTYNGQEVSLQQLSGVLQTVDGQQAVIWQVTQTLPDGTSRIALVNTKGGGSQFLVDAANAYFSGNLIVAGTIRSGALYASDFARIGSDTDNGNYSAAALGSVQTIDGLVVSLPATTPAPYGTLKIDFSALVTLGQGGTKRTYFDSVVEIVANMPDGTSRVVGGAMPTGIGQRVVAISVEADVPCAVAGTIVVTARLRRGGTEEYDSEPPAGYRRSATISATQFSLTAKWRFL